MVLVNHNRMLQLMVLYLQGFCDSFLVGGFHVPCVRHMVMGLFVCPSVLVQTFLSPKQLKEIKCNLVHW